MTLANHSFSLGLAGNKNESFAIYLGSVRILKMYESFIQHKNVKNKVEKSKKAEHTNKISLNNSLSICGPCVIEGYLHQQFVPPLEFFSYFFS